MGEVPRPDSGVNAPPATITGTFSPPRPIEFSADGNPMTPEESDAAVKRDMATGIERAQMPSPAYIGATPRVAKPGPAATPLSFPEIMQQLEKAVPASPPGRAQRVPGTKGNALSGYSEMMESLQESDTPLARFIAPRPDITKGRAELPPVEIPADAGFFNAASREAVNAAEGLAEFGTSDAGVLTALFSRLAPRLVSAGYSADMSYSAFKQAKETVKNWSSMTPSQKGKAFVDTLFAMTLGGLLGVHATGKRMPKLSPVVTDMTKADYSSATPGDMAHPEFQKGLFGTRGPLEVEPLPITPVISAPAPAPEQPRLEPPARPVPTPDTTGLVEWPVPPPEMPVVTEPVVVAEPVSDAVKRAREVRAMPSDVFLSSFKKGVNPENWELGETATASDVAEFKKHLAEIGKEMDDLKSSAKGRKFTLEEMELGQILGTKGQYFSEAIQAAPKEVGGNGRVFIGAEERAKTRAKTPEAPPVEPAPAAPASSVTTEHVNSLYAEVEPGRDFKLMSQKISDFWNTGNVEALRDWTMHGKGFNDSTKSVVFRLMGKKVPSSIEAIGKALDEHFGITPEKRAEIIKAAENKRAAEKQSKEAAANEKAAAERLARVGPEVVEFTKGMKPMESGRTDSVLSKQVAKQTGGKTYTGKASEVVSQLLDAGFKPESEQVDAIQPVSRTRWNRMDAREQAEWEKRKAEAGKKTEYRLIGPEGRFFSVTKAEHDFAKYLQEKKPTPEPPAAQVNETPMQKQYRQVKESNPDAVVLIRLGDFYEAFGEDAKTLSEIGKISLTKRNNVPMSGVPYHAANSYIAKLQAAGKKVVVHESGKSEVVPELNKPETPATQPPAQGGSGLAKNVRNKWTSATDPGLGSESGFISLAPIQALIDRTSPYVKSVVDTIMAAGKQNFNLAKATDFRRSILNWSAKLQRSFGEAASAQKEIQSRVKDPIRRDGITNWIQAGGDRAILSQRLAATRTWRDPTTGRPHPQAKQLIAGYEAALNLTPDELAVAAEAKTAYDDLGTRGQTYDVLKTFKDNYVTQIWNLKRSPKAVGVGGSLMLKDRFKFSKASTFPTFFDGEQAGYVPMTKDISKLLPVYLHEMNSVIAARQLVEQMSKGKASDGLPLLAPRGVGVQVHGPKGQATLVMPDVPTDKLNRYVVIENQPALHEWRWVSKDAAGNPVFNRSDLMVHPEVADHFKNVLGRSAIREWYTSKTSAAAEIPKALARGLDLAQSETKRLMLGVLTPFHQVQEGTHAIGHRVNPFFNNPKIDLVNDPAQMDAARHGLMLLPDRTSANQFMEGFKQSALVTKIPGLGTLANHYSDYLFHEYIPGIKYKTYQAILNRNTHLYDAELTTGKATLADVKILSAEQANAAYGHLNYADLGRNPTIMHLMRLGLLAPDFLEARARFAGQAIKGVTGAKIGREQLIALATLAVAQATLAWTAAKITGGTWDEKDPFTFHVGNRKFTMRSVPEDLYRAVKDTRAFWYARLNPIIGRGLIQYGSGTDWRGQKVTAGQTTKELLTQPVPLALRPLVGLGNTPLSAWEEISGAVGLKISRYSTANDIYKMAHDWMANSADPKIKAAEERYRKSTFPDSDYKPLREALVKNDMAGAQTAYDHLVQTRTPKVVEHTMQHSRPFTGTPATEAKFKQSLTEDQKMLYERAQQERQENYKKFLRLKRTPGQKVPAPIPTGTMDIPRI